MSAAHEKTCRELDDLAMMCRRLVRALRKADPKSPLPDLATGLLRRQNWLGSPLRSPFSGEGNAPDSTR